MGSFHETMVFKLTVLHLQGGSSKDSNKCTKILKNLQSSLLRRTESALPSTDKSI